jgi:glutamine amidotransferase
MRANCHPFAHQNWSFAHNGQIGGFHKMQRLLKSLLSDELYQAR